MASASVAAWILTIFFSHWVLSVIGFGKSKESGGKCEMVLSALARKSGYKLCWVLLIGP